MADRTIKEKNSACEEFCPAHLLTNSRLNTLESKLEVQETNATTVYKLAARVNLLIAIMSATAVMVVGGAVYTFTALGQFKQAYSQDQLAIQSQLHNIELKVDDKFNSIDHRLTIIEATNSIQNKKN